MRRRHLEFMSLGLLLAPIFPLSAQNVPIKLVQTIPMPNVQGRLDHFGVDVKSKRVFVAALGDNQNTVEVLDLTPLKRAATTPAKSKPQGIFYPGKLNKLSVPNETD